MRASNRLMSRTPSGDDRPNRSSATRGPSSTDPAAARCSKPSTSVHVGPHTTDKAGSPTLTSRTTPDSTPIETRNVVRPAEVATSRKEAIASRAVAAAATARR